MGYNTHYRITYVLEATGENKKLWIRWRWGNPWDLKQKETELDQHQEAAIANWG